MNPPHPGLPHPAAPFVTIVIPTWNDAALLPSCIESVNLAQPDIEIIVADAGSTDATCAVARTFGVQVISSPVRQRAAQLNRGAAQARGAVLLFLHADTILPAGWKQVLTRALRADAGLVGGAFRRRFDRRSPWLQLTCVLADWRGRLWGCFLGDQAMFIRTKAFLSLGGFRPTDQCEDLDLSLRMAQAGRTCLLSPPVLSSARRFIARGPIRQTFSDLITAWRFIRQRPPE